eukprot:Lankesteria_metandrocarpae@DN4962_c0_g1_i2.p1
MPRRRTESSAVLGRAVTADHRRKAYESSKVNKNAKVTDFMNIDTKKADQTSIVERNALDDYLSVTLANNTNFEVDRESRFAGQKHKPNDQRLILKGANNPTSSTADIGIVDVPIPRRPITFCGPDFDMRKAKANLEFTKEGIDNAEFTAFAQWRKDLSLYEEERGFTLTPYEKNIEFWRQLWRVAERSDVIVQILDARDPLFYCCRDFIRYVAELDSEMKKVILLLNKCDFLSHTQRQLWYEYFKNHENIEVVFFSAIRELNAQGALNSTATSEGDQNATTATEIDETISNLGHGNLDIASNNTPWDVLSCEELLTYLKRGREVVLEKKRQRQRELSSLKVDLKTEHNHAKVVQQKRVKEKIVESLRREEAARKLRNLHHKRSQARRLGLPMPELEPDPKIEGSGDSDDDDGGSYATTSDGTDSDSNDEDDEGTTASGTADKPSPRASTAAHTGGTCTPDNEVVDEIHDMEYIVGMVGFPNVGKSSIINALFGEKKTSVSRQPGKTKHFQTLRVPDSGITLCDCPGLVFPSIVASKEHLVIKGVVPIDHFRGDYVEPVNVLCQMIGKSLARFYNVTDALKAGAPITGATLLTALANRRRYISGGKGGLPDLYRSAKIVLRDYCTGKMCHCIPPPNILGDAPIAGGSMTWSHRAGADIDASVWESTKWWRMRGGSSTAAPCKSANANAVWGGDDTVARVAEGKAVEAFTEELLEDLEDIDQILFEGQMQNVKAKEQKVTKRKERAMVKRFMRGRDPVGIPNTGVLNMRTTAMNATGMNVVTVHDP